MNGIARDVASYAMAAVLGVGSIVVPVVIFGINEYDHPLFPAVINGIEKYSSLSLVFQLLSGFLLGIGNPERSWRWGVAMMVPFPALAFFDMAFSLSAHNLWPLEFVVYALLAIPCILGAWAGAFVGNKVRKHKSTLSKSSPVEEE